RQEGPHELTRMERWQYLRRNATANEDTARRNRAQREVAGFGAICLDEDGQRLSTTRSGATQRRRRNSRWGTRILEIHSRAARRVVERSVNVHQPAARDDALHLDPAEACGQRAKQDDFALVPCREIGVARLRCRCHGATTDRLQDGLS